MKALLNMTIVIFLFLSQPLLANDNVCGAALCLAGGQVSGECASYVKKFFSIEVWVKKHDDWFFSPSKTSDKRKGYLGGCADADPSTIRDAIANFGKVRK